MNWFEDNPVGVALAACCGLLVLMAVGLGLWWSQPVPGVDEADAESALAAVKIAGIGDDMGPLEDYDEINERPVFNESRRPVLTEAGTDEEGLLVEEVDPSEAPDVRLTSVVITPEMRIVTLTPASDGEPIRVREGHPLEGEYVGWSVSEVGDRGATLESREGRSLNVELTVYDQMIKEPPKPEPKPEPVAETAATDDGDNSQPLSRADEIRQRIQERREQLRREAEEQDTEEREDVAAERNRYQEAIQAMMNRNRKPQEEREAKDDESE